MAISTQIQNLNLIPGKSAPVVVHLSQGNVGNTVQFYLYDGDNPYYPTNVSIAVHGVRADGSVFGPYAVSFTSGSNLVRFSVVSTMTSVSGAAIGELVLTDNDQNQIGTANFGMLVEEAPYSSTVTYEDDLSIYQRILAYVQSFPASISGQVAEEATRATNAENTLDSKITSETTRATNAEGGLSSEISAETTRATNAESALNTRINQIISPSGSAPSAAEVTDARIGYNGTTYSNLGTAIRTQFNELLPITIYNNLAGPVPVVWSNMTWTISRSGITVTERQKGVIHISGAATEVVRINTFVSDSSLPTGMEAGKTYFTSINVPNRNRSRLDYLVALYYNANSSGSANWTWFDNIYPNADRFITIPANAKGLLIRYEIYVTGTTLDDDLYVTITNLPNLQYLARHALTSASDVLPSCDLNTLYGSNSFYLLTDSNTYSNIPSGQNVGFLQSTMVATWCLQMFYSLNEGKIWKRRASNATSWSNWAEISGGGQIINNYNTYEVTSSPTITTDTNNYLAAPGDSSDMTLAIQTMLSSTGVCNLGPGTFYVTGIDVPDNATLRGCGAKTVIRLADSVTDGYAVRLSKWGIVSDLKLAGAESEGITPSETVRARHGILFEGDYDGARNNLPKMCQLSNLYIFGFAGGGITCNNTGFGYDESLNAVNCYIWNCDAGINVAYWSEFNRFTNISVHGCYYGCINNGGNNTFTSCDFSGNRGIGVLMDNKSRQSPNNTHGSMVGCVINHTASNTGIGIKVLNCPNGYIFTGCQLFFSQIYIEDSLGINISDTNFGLNNCDITISGGGLIVFANNIHQGTPTITITNNTNVHFDNCYSRADGSAITA